MFDEMSKRDLVSWNAMICGCVGNCVYVDAVKLFYRMGEEELEPNSVTLVGLLAACGELLEYRLGQEIHCHCLRHGFLESQPHIGTSLIGFYSRFGLKYARDAFNSMTMRSTACWNAIMCEFLENRDVFEALDVFSHMLEELVAPDSVTLIAVLQSCAESENSVLGKQVHQLAIKTGFASNEFVGNALIDLYGKCGDSRASFTVFEEMLTKDLASWNAMISAYKNCRLYDRALDLFWRMKVEDVDENTITIAATSYVCAQLGDFNKGKQLHAYAIKTRKTNDVALDNALLSMYVKFDCMVSSLKIFHEMDKSDVVSWNTIIAGLLGKKMTHEAWDLFKQMVQSRTQPNSHTMVSLLGGCNDTILFNAGKSIHAYIVRHNLDVNSALCTALSEMYMDCGDESAALHIFWSSCRDLISWNSMMACYIRNGKLKEALALFYLMRSESKPNSASLINVLSSCAHMAHLMQGKCLHGYIVRRELGFSSDIQLGNALLTMYAKCGSLSNAENIFRNLAAKDIISWNAMIAAYGMHGRGEDALRVFNEMLQCGMRPTGVTFVSALFACSHSGLVEKGVQLFQSMNSDYNIKPETIHYACFVDLLARSGNIDEAIDLVNSLPVNPDSNIWRALLSSCKVSSDIELARAVTEKLIELEPQNIGNYILLSNIYAAVGSWEDVQELRARIEELGLKKDPGNSWLFTRDELQSFTAGNKSGPASDQA